MNTEENVILSKVPQVTLTFWIIKILATTLGETGGDSLSMSMNLGYLVSTGIFAAIFFVAVAIQISAKKFTPALYWTTIIATTTVGTTLADYATRSIGIGYAGGSILLFTLLISSLLLWYFTLGSIAVDTVNTPKVEMFYWITIMFSQTLGTALGDWLAAPLSEDPVGLGLGYLGAGGVFSLMLAVVAVVFYTSQFSRPILFWAAFIITRPLGAVVGDFLDKPISHGGLELSRYSASAVILGLIVLCILFFPQKAAQKVH